MDDIMDHISFGTIPIKMDGIPVLAYEELDFMNAYLDIVGEEFMQDLFNDEYLAYIMMQSIGKPKDVVYTAEDLKAWHPKDKNILRKQLVDDYLRLTNNEQSRNNNEQSSRKRKKNQRKNKRKK